MDEPVHACIESAVGVDVSIARLATFSDIAYIEAPVGAINILGLGKPDRLRSGQD